MPSGPVALAQLMTATPLVGGVPGDALLAGAGTINASKVFQMYVIMLGGIGVLWVTYATYKSRARSIKALNYLYVPLICTSWATMSVGMNVVNKTLVTLLQTPALCSAVQMLVASVVIGVMSSRELCDVDMRQLATWMVVPVLFSAMLLSSFYMYEYVSFSLLTIVHNLSPLLVLPVERHFMRPEQCPRVSLEAVLAICIMIAGAAIYGSYVEDISRLGVFLAVLNMFVAIVDRVVQRRLLTEECKGMHSSVCTFACNLVGLLPSMAIALASGQYAKLTHPEPASNWSDLWVLALLFCSGLLGLSIGVLGFECQRAMSATSLLVMQNGSKVILVVIGCLFFGDQVTLSAVFAIALSMFGAMVYGHSQLTLEKDPEPAEATGLVHHAKSPA